MKNRVLRLAVVAMLVVAMTLTMAACAAPAAPVVEAPKAPQAPAAAPVEDVKAPVVAPAPVEDTVVDAPAAAPSAEDALKADYGITVEATNKTYGAKKKDNITDDPATIVVKIPKGFDTTRYTVSYDVEAVDYEGLSLNKPTKDTIQLALSTNVSTDDKGNTLRTVTFVDAGTYTVEFTISIQPEEVKFGFFGIPKAEDPDEYTITKTVEVAKKAVEITIEDNFQPVEDDDDAEEIDAEMLKVVGLDGVSDFTLKFSDNNAKAELLAALNGKFYVSVPSYDPKVPGVITVSLVYAKDNYEDEDDLLDFAEVLEDVPNYTFTLGTGTINILSSYEWNEVGDVITSVLDIPAAPATATDKEAAIAGSDQYALALKRYEALTDSQVVFLKNIGDITDVDGFASDITLVAGKAFTAVNDTTGKKLVEWLAEDLKKAYDAKIAKDANMKIWEDVVEAAEWTLYGAGFNVNNEFAMASFNVIDAFVKANSAVLKNLEFVNKYTGAFVEGKDDDFDNYLDAIEAISDAKVFAVTELIKGAEAAYDKAILNGDFPYYVGTIDGIPVSYIDNDEVDLLVKYALDAYNALTKVEKAAVDNDADAKSDTVKALAKMSDVVDSMKEVTEYVKIENYAKKNSDIYATLRKLVYGEGLATGDFFGNAAGGAQYWAMKDLATNFADDEVRAAVVAEYKAWIDVVVAFEEVKEAAVDAFDVAFNEYCADKELSDEDIEGSKTGYDAIVAKIMNGTTDGTYLGIKYPTVASILAKNPETVDEAKEYFEDAFDGEKIAKNLQYVSDAWIIA